MKDIGSSFKTKKTTRPIIQRWTFFPFYSPEIVPIKRGGRKMVNNFGINSGISGSLTWLDNRSLLFHELCCTWEFRNCPLDFFVMLCSLVVPPELTSFFLWRFARTWTKQGIGCRQDTSFKFSFIKSASKGPALFTHTVKLWSQTTLRSGLFWPLQPKSGLLQHTGCFLYWSALKMSAP